MNTKKQKTHKNLRKSDGERFAQIALLGESIFHADDLANLWNIRNKNTLHRTLFRYVKRGLIYRIYNGLYSIKKIGELDSYLLGIKSLHRPAYISCESILYEYGVLNQRPQIITLVSSISKSFSIGQMHYRSRQMRDEYLFNDSGIEVIDGVRKASLARAVADMLYFNREKYLDAFDSKLIDWILVEKIIKDVGYQIKL
ncbi:MAG: hypothetical protein WCW54_00770 [Candidatus Paceibacterota bacterium]